MKKYCTECGYKIEYTAKQPNFCPSCGEGLNASARANKPAQTVIEQQPEIEESQEEVANIPQLQGLDIEIQPDVTKGVKLGQVFAEASENDDRPINDSYKPPRISKKKILDEFKREAGTLRNPKSD
jgi:hypothetical protein|tara:strand:- start:14660 stop:15037 length:378 start_codon:yes stop_codon:yes gene_type:complete